MAALELPFGLRVLNPQSVDDKYLSGGTTPYTSVANANATIPEAIRHIGLTVNVDNVEYWYKDGVTDGDLVLKTAGGAPTSISGERIEKYIEQSNTFSVGDVVGYSGDSPSGEYVLGLATTDFDGEIHGLVSEASSSGFTVVYAGYVTGITKGGLQENTTYFVSDTIPGELIDTAPSTTGSTIKPIFNTTSAADEGLVFQYLAFAVTTGVTGGGSSGVTTGATFGIGESVFIDVDGEIMNFRSIEGTGGTIVTTVGDTIFISGGSAAIQVTNDSAVTYNATNDDDYIGSSGITTVVLPSGPTDGKKIIIADIKGDAFTNNVTIQGNGNNIQGSTFALINTDYGAITLLWNGVIWSVTSFVN